MTPEQFADARNHQLLAEMIERAYVLGEPITSSLKSEEHRLQSVLTIAEYIPLRIIGEPPRLPPSPVPRLTKRQYSIVALLNQENPMKAERIITKLGLNPASGSIYSYLSELERLGVIRRLKTGGYVLTPLGAAARAQAEAPELFLA